ncbi:hypothetical protein KP509_35G022500 [Ceratopteris richardii]|uniref:Peptidase A1 domain-containing protein n=1 Tax=Ceratopteris richardii TaxID=49495 RepID=A0A8T2QFR4_CERRI|nr:hypothetical protein KP509_35G022500 [Ceratopteris richardii]
MTSRCCLHYQLKRLLPIIMTCFVAESLSLVQSKGNITIIKLHHVYADLVASARKSSDKGISREHIELFKAHDRSRHGRVLGNVVEFPVGGSSNPFVAGIYFTRVRIGTPSKEYYVQVDTGSDLLWLNCNPCTACPRSNNLGMILVPYDPQASTTSSPITCIDSICEHSFKVSSNVCDTTQLCSYGFQYGDGSSTTGYLVSDTFIYNTIHPNNTLANNEARIVFGCGYSQSGNLLTAQNVVDGIIGFGQSKLSVISQLYSQGLTPAAFAHCLQGSEQGGGILVVGNIVGVKAVYTPIVSSQPHYNLNLRGISVGSNQLIVDESAYETTNLQGTIIDSGTTLAYLIEPIYTSFINAIIKGAPDGAHLLAEQGVPCFMYMGSVDDTFPMVTLHFEGADMILKARHYLIRQADVNTELWCVGWHPISYAAAVGGGLLTILGDIVLKDQLIIYDLDNQQIGWVNYEVQAAFQFPQVTGKANQ